MASIAAALRSPAAAGECPNPISSVQEQQLVKFGEVTGTDEVRWRHTLRYTHTRHYTPASSSSQDVAHAILEAHDWDLASAIMHYISQPIQAPRPPQAHAPAAHAPQPQPRPPSLLPLPSPPAAPLAAQRARSGSSFGSLDVDSLFMAAPTSPGVLRSPCDSVEAVANYHPHTLVGFTPEDEKLASVATGVPNPPPAWGPAGASPVRPFTSVVAASPARAPPQGKASSTRSPAAAPAITPPPVPQQPRAPPPVKAPSLVPMAPAAAAAPKPLENGEQLYTKVTLRQASEMFPLLEDDLIGDVIATHAGNMAEV